MFLNLQKSLLTRLLTIKQSRLFNTSSFLSRKFAYKDFAYDNYRGDGGTLINRLVKHVAVSNSDLRPSILGEIKYSDFYPLHDVRNFKNQLRTITANDMSKLLMFSYTYKNNADVNKFVDAVNEIDREYTNRLRDLDVKSVLNVLYGFVFLIPNRTAQTEFYANAMVKLTNDFRKELPKGLFVEVCLYLGLWKKNDQSTVLMGRFLERYLDRYLDEMETMDLVIVSNAAFKVSQRIESAAFNERIIDEVIGMNNGLDVQNFVTFIKCIRHNRLKSHQLNDFLKKLVTTERINDFDFRGLVHLLTFFADNLMNDDKVSKILIDKCFNEIKENYDFYNDTNLNFRPKDVASLVWSCAYLNLSHLLEDSHYELLNRVIQHNCDNSHYDRNQDELVDTLLSLWMLGERFVQYLPRIKQQNNYGRSEDRVRLDSRINLLFTLAEIETPNIFNSKISKDIFNDSEALAPDHRLIKHRPKLRHVYNALKDCSDQLKLPAISYVSQIKNLNIAGIVIGDESNNEKYHIEVNDATNTLSDRQTANGIFNLKLRLLEHYKCNVIEIPCSVEGTEEVIRIVRDKIGAASDSDSTEEVEVSKN